MSDCLQPQGLYSPWNCPGQDTGVGRLSLLQRIFPTQGLNPGLPHCRQTLYSLSHQEIPQNLHDTVLSMMTLCDPMDPLNSLGQNTGVGRLSLLQRILPIQESNWSLLHCRQILCQLNYQGSPYFS